VIASTAGLVASLVLVAVIQIFAMTVLKQGDTAFLSQLTLMSLAALVTATTVGATTFALGLRTTNRINLEVDNLQAQFNALAEGHLGISSTVSSTQEFRQLAMSFNNMAKALNTRLSEAQRKADEQEKIKQDLQEQLIELIHQDLEKRFDLEATEQPEEIIADENEPITNPQEKIIDLIAELNNITRFRESINPNLLLSTTTLNEIQQHKNELEYRKSWLKALVEETQRELNYLTLLIHSNEQGEELSN
jgi:methyl-accepting chemotaxis protein